jgi:hypothetical protein
MSFGRAALNATPTELQSGHRARTSALVMLGNLALTIKAGSNSGVAMMGLLFTLHSTRGKRLLPPHTVYEAVSRSGNRRSLEYIVDNVTL